MTLRRLYSEVTGGMIVFWILSLTGHIQISLYHNKLWCPAGQRLLLVHSVTFFCFFLLLVQIVPLLFFLVIKTCWILFFSSGVFLTVRGLGLYDVTLSKAVRRHCLKFEFPGWLGKTPQPVS